MSRKASDPFYLVCRSRGKVDIVAELRDELLNDEIFYSLKEAQIVIEQWRRHYNTIRPHSALN
jgi:transposase InsO family protein